MPVSSAGSADYVGSESSLETTAVPGVRGPSFFRLYARFTAQAHSRAPQAGWPGSGRVRPELDGPSVSSVLVFTLYLRGIR